MNQGLRSYCKLLSQDIGNAGKAFVNVNQTNANLHLVIPIYKTPGLSPIDLSLIYSHADRTSVTEFGKGGKLNLYKKFTISTDRLSIEVLNSDGSVDVFTKTGEETPYSVFQCKRIHCVIQAILETDLLRFSTLYYYDKFGNYWLFVNNQNYPSDIMMINGTHYALSIDENQFIQVSNLKGDAATFVWNGNCVSRINFFHENSMNFSILFSYINDFISTLTYMRGTTTLYTTSYELGGTTVKAVDNLSAYRIHYTLSGNQVTSFKDGTTSALTGGLQTTLTYNGSYSTATNYRGYVNYFYFTPDNLPMYDIDDQARAVAYKYVYNAFYDTLELESQTDVVVNNPADSAANNLVTNGYFDSDVDGWTASAGSMEVVNDTTNLFHAILGDKTLKVTSSANITAQISQTISASGLAGDDVTLYLWAREVTCGSVAADYLATASVTLKQGTTTVCSGTIQFTKYNLGSSAPWELRGIGVKPLKSYDSIIVTMTVSLNSIYTFDAIQIIRTPMGNLYQYDSQGNILTATSQKSTSDTTYTSSDSTPKNRPSTTLSPVSALFNYEYDAHGNVKRSTAAYGVASNNTFDANNNPTFSTIKSDTASFQSSSSYTSGGYPNTQTDEAGYTSSFDYDETYGQLTSANDPLATTNDFSYDSFGLVSATELHRNASSVSASYTYDTRKRLSTVTAPHGDVYKYAYDTWNHLLSVSVGRSSTYATNKLVTYEYQNQDVPSAPQTGNVTKVTYGNNGDSYKFHYNTLDQMTEIDYLEAGETTEQPKFSFVYSPLGQLTRVTSFFADSETAVDYTYNPQGQIVEKNDNDERLIAYAYDSQGNVIQEKFDMYGTIDFVSTNPQYWSQGMNPEAAYPLYQNTYRYYTCFMNRFVYDSQTGHYSTVRSLDIINFYNRTPGEQPQAIAPSVSTGLAATVTSMIPSINFTSQNGRLAYDVDTSHDISQPPRETVGFWFKPSSVAQVNYLFSVRNPSNGAMIGVYFGSNMKLVLKIQEDNGTVHDNLLVTDTICQAGQWNFFSLTWYNRFQITPQYINTCQFDLTLNNERKTFVKSSPRYIVNNGSPLARLYLGCYFDGTSELNKMSGLISAIIISNGYSLTTTEIDDFYLSTKEYIFRNVFVGQNDGAVTAGSTNVYSNNPTFLSTYEIIPLNTSMTGLSGKTPLTMSLGKQLAYNRTQSFRFNRGIMRYAYAADGAELVYDFAAQNSGFIGFRASINGEGTYQYLFQNVDANGLKLDLYRYSDPTSSVLHRLYIDLNGTLINTGINFDNNVWSYFGFTWSRTIISESIPTYQYQIRLVMQNPYILSIPLVFETAVETSYTFGPMVTSIGRTKTGRVVNSVTVVDPLYGQLEMLTYRNAFLSQATIQSLWNDVAVVSLSNHYDVFGRLKNHYLTKDSQASTCYQTYEYAANHTYLTQTTSLVSAETFVFTNLGQDWTFNYVYDGNGNITSITDGAEVTAYQYDYRNYLTQETGPSFSRKYAYDSNGNITSIKNLDNTVVTSFTYDTSSTHKMADRLLQFNDKKLSYDTGMFTNPTHYGTFDSQGVFVSGVSYSWEGRSLIRYFDNSVSPNLDVGYAYNESGLRIRKTVNGVEHSYEYDGDRLVYEHTSNTSLRFIYDERGLLASLLYNTNGTWSRYHYVRDVTLNIFGLTDDAGNLVVRYTYDAWGNILSITGTMASTIGVLNPFRYKGYYFDSETGMYYCQTRYYVPQWSRWLSADSPKYLDVDSPEGINLFAYCGNNPVNRADPSGHIWLALLFGFVIGAVIGFGSATFSDYQKDGVWFNGNWQDYAFEISLGAISGALGAFIPGGNFLLGLGLSASLGGATQIASDAYYGKLNDDSQWYDWVLSGVKGAAIAGLSFSIAYGVTRYLAKNQYNSITNNQTHPNRVNKALRNYGIDSKTIFEGKKAVISRLMDGKNLSLFNTMVNGWLDYLLEGLF